MADVLKRQSQFIFYEFTFLAASRVEEHDLQVALLMAVVALEGAHAAFVRTVLGPKLSGLVKDEAGVVNGYLRDVGFYFTNIISASLLLEEADRPSPGAIEQCRV